MTSTLTVCQKCETLNNVSLEKLKNQSAVCGHCGAPLHLLGAVTEVNEKNFWRILRSAKKPVIVDFWASWCGPCKVYGPQFQQASLKTDQAIFLKVSTEDNPQLSQKLGIRGIPTTIVFENQKEVNRQSGALPAEGVLSLL